VSVITLSNVSKSYRTYARPWDRLKEAVTQRPRHQEHHALKPLSLEIGEGRVVGLVGANGAGKSTLLKLIAGTLQPTTGTVTVKGQVAALLELGAGFHPEMSGRENVYLGAAVAGLSREHIESRYEDIVSFTGLAEAMDRPVKTYSSGMSARLAFAVAMAVEPEILILDETLSVGDGAFARRSFERIIDFKNAGKTLLFCSHSMYQVEAICDRVLWIDRGQVMLDDEPPVVISAYSEFLSKQANPPSPENQTAEWKQEQELARLVNVQVTAGGGPTLKRVTAKSGESDLTIRVRFQSSLEVPIPSLGVVLVAGNGWAIASASSRDDGLTFERTSDEQYEACITFPKLSLLKGNYWVNVFLLCEKGLHLYDRAERVAEIEVRQECRELGVVSLPRSWENLSD
jgi:lipopolysaccharide transport system ATP-binding protein